jgi:hypothetical protein
MTDEQPGTVGVIGEYLNDEELRLLQDGSKDASIGQLATVYGAASSVLNDKHRERVALVFTGDFVRSVIDRNPDLAGLYDIKRGSGFAIAKTMPPNDEGRIDILLPAFTLYQTDDAADQAAATAILQHTAAHEAVHAAAHVEGDVVASAWERNVYSEARREFVQIAGDQASEYLAEGVANLVFRAGGRATVADTTSNLEAFAVALKDGFASVPSGSPREWVQKKRLTLTAFHVLGKTLAYLAAELRSGDRTLAPPPEVVATPGWRTLVAPWWDQYVCLLEQIPLTPRLDADVTDALVESLATLLQEWLAGLGFSYLDTPQGPHFYIR